jgi:hypothetical protein
MNGSKSFKDKLLKKGNGFNKKGLGLEKGGDERKIRIKKEFLLSLKAIYYYFTRR